MLWKSGLSRSISISRDELKRRADFPEKFSFGELLSYIGYKSTAPVPQTAAYMKSICSIDNERSSSHNRTLFSLLPEACVETLCEDFDSALRSNVVNETDKDECPVINRLIKNGVAVDIDDAFQMMETTVNVLRAFCPHKASTFKLFNAVTHGAGGFLTSSLKFVERYIENLQM